MAIPGDTRIASKEEEKIEKYKALSQDIRIEESGGGADCGWSVGSCY